MPEPPDTARSYATAREALLARIHAGLQEDPRLVAAWLLGSYGRGEQDAVSDIDLAVVVDTPFSAAFCTQTAVTGTVPPAVRLDLFLRFGEPANIHENNNNAPAGGAFTSVLYRDPPAIVDWTLLPRALALRPKGTLLLFDRAGIPHREVDRIELPSRQRTGDRPSLSERIAFFWMMAAVTAKYIVRGRADDTWKLLSSLENILAEIALIASQPPLFTNRPSSPDKASQPIRLRQLCEAIEILSQQATPAGEKSVSPRGQIEAILKIAEAGSPAERSQHLRHTGGGPVGAGKRTCRTFYRFPIRNRQWNYFMLISLQNRQMDKSCRR